MGSLRTTLDGGVGENEGCPIGQRLGNALFGDVGDYLKTVAVHFLVALFGQRIHTEIQQEDHGVE